MSSGETTKKKSFKGKFRFGKSEKEKTEAANAPPTSTVVDPKASSKESSLSKWKKNKNKSRISSSSLESPSYNRKSPVLEGLTSSATEAPTIRATGLEEKEAKAQVKASSTPPFEAEETVFAEDSTRPRHDSDFLFDDDPRRPAQKSNAKAMLPHESSKEEEVKRKPEIVSSSSASSSQERDLWRRVERELRGREKELYQNPTNVESSVPERILLLFSALDENHKLFTATRLSMKEKHNGEMAKEREKLALMKTELQTSGKKLKEKDESILEYVNKVETLNKQIKAAEKTDQDKQDALRTELTNQISKLQHEVEQARVELAEELVKFAREREQLETKLQQQENEVEELRRDQVKQEVQEDAVIVQKDEILDDEAGKQQLETELAELQKQCDEQQIKITELEKAQESKSHGHEKIVKKYESSIAKLEKLLLEEKNHGEAAEQKLKDALEGPSDQEKGTHQELEEELKEKNKELEELQKRLQERVGEQEIKKEDEEKQVAELEDKLRKAEKQIQDQETEKENEKQKFVKLQENLRIAEEQVQEQRAKENKEKEELEEKLRTTEEQLREQETKREEAQKKLDTLQRTMKAESAVTKSAKEVEEYSEGVMKLCEELTDWREKAEERARKIEKLNTTVKRAEMIDAEYLEAKKGLSEAEATIEALQTPSAAAVGGDEAGAQTTSEPHTSSPETKRLKKEVRELKDKLSSRDDEIKNLKRRASGATPFTDPLSPTDSMPDDNHERSELKQNLKTKETELKNLQKQVGSMEQNLKELEEMKRTHEGLKEETEKLAGEVAKLKREKQILNDHMKQQSEKIVQLRNALDNKPKVQTESEEYQKLKNEADTARLEAESALVTLASMKSKVEELTLELDKSKEECKRQEMAFDIANDEAQHRQKKLEDDVKSLQQRRGKMEKIYTATREENTAYKKEIEEMKKGKESSTSKLQQEVAQLKEAAQLKDEVMQQVMEEQEKVKGKLLTAQAKCEELQKLSDGLLKDQEQLRGNNLELKQLQEEVKVKTAQVTQYKKQLEQKQGGQTQQQSEDIELLEGKLASSQTRIEETEKELEALITKHSEMLKHYEKKTHEMDGVVTKMKAHNQHLQDRLSEANVRQKLVQKERELEKTQAQQHQVEMANELTRLQRDRKREDEFSRAFQEEFQAHKVVQARNEELEKNLGVALDYLDEMKQKQEVLKQALVAHRLELPFVETEQQPPIFAADVSETAHGISQAQWQPQVAISQKPIASPGVYNQHVDSASYMPPHSNAQSQYIEQQMAEQRQQRANWDQQEPTGMGAVAPGAVQRSSQLANRRAASFECDAVMGVPASAMIRPIGAHNLQPSAPPHQWPLVSRHSDGEIGTRGGGSKYATYPASPHRLQLSPNMPEAPPGVTAQNQQNHLQPPMVYQQISSEGQVSPSVDPQVCTYQAGYPGHQPGDPQQQRANMEQIPHSGQNQQNIGQLHGQQQANPGQHPRIGQQELNAGQPQQTVPYQAHLNQFPPNQQQVGDQAIGQPPANMGQCPQPGINPPPLPDISQQSDFPNTLPPPCSDFSNPSNPLAPTTTSQRDFVKPVQESGVVEQPKPPSVPRPEKTALAGISATGKRDRGGSKGTKQPASSVRKDSDTPISEGLMTNLTGTIQDTFVEVKEKDDVVNNSGIPLDPNLECVICGMVFKIGQIQKFKRHSENCTGSRST